MKFTINLAKVNIEINSIYDEVYTLCKDYLCDNTPDFAVEIMPEDIAFEREKSKREAAAEHIPYVDFKDSYLETLAVYRKIVTNLLDFGAFLMHGAVVGLDGKAYMFTAPSGVGKTTHTGFWLETFPDAFIINGDKPILRFEGDRVYACGTPWAGKEGKNKNISLPLNAICLLERGKENEIVKAGFKQIYPFIISQTYRPYDEKHITKTMQYIKDLGEKVKFYLLKCNLDPSAANIAFDGMNNVG